MPATDYYFQTLEKCIDWEKTAETIERICGKPIPEDYRNDPKFLRYFLRTRSDAIAGNYNG